MSTDSLDNLAWFQAARQGSLDALGQGLEAQRRYLLAIAEREMAGDLKAKEGASDVVQEAFLEAQRAFPQFQGSTEEEFQGWLRMVLLHQVSHFQRRYRQTGKRDVRREADPEAGRGLAAATPTPSQEVAADELSAKVQRLMIQLPEEYQTVIRLRYQEDLPFEEIGKRLGKTAEAARKVWWRAIAKLQGEMGGPHDSTG